MQFHGTRSAPISMTWAVPWNSMELGVLQFRWQEQFHGIPWNFACANFDDSSSSMEFHGIALNLECANFADTSSSMEFHVTWSAPISLTRAIPWNSMELGVRQYRWHKQFQGTKNAPISLTRAVPWNSMELEMRQFRWHEKFIGIPWNLECTNFDDMSSSMEFHGTWSAPISMTREVPWNSMELGVRQFRWHEKFHGIPLNLKCANFADRSSSMEFHGYPCNLEYANFNDTKSSMEFRGTRCAPILLTQAVPWNSMELRMRQFCWQEQFHGIPWN